MQVQGFQMLGNIAPVTVTSQERFSIQHALTENCSMETAKSLLIVKTAILMHVSGGESP